MGITESFPVKVGLHQGLALSPFIFTVIMEEVSKSREEVSNKLDEWREAVEGKGLRISRTKTEYLHCDFSGTTPVGELEVSIDEAVIKSTTKYKYLRSIIQRDVEIDGDVNHRIQAG